ncbi:MAG: TonB-dependent receptor [Deltaproteobacteria bacterium]|nr:TonB-dependent receptor [Deltaproteobacteria bacterium]
MHLTNHLRKAFFIAVACLLLTVFSGYAAEESSEDYVLEDTVVTATKTGETRLQETPVAITAFSDEFMKDANISRIEDLTMFVPNAEFTNMFGYAQGFIRGVGNGSPFAIGGETNISYYLDGVYLERGLGSNTDFIDVERIEVLRGPQGTLYGRNATSGAVNIITRGPSDKFELDVGAEIGNFNKRRFDIGISGPVVRDKIKGRLSVSSSRRDGYVKNLIGPDPYDEDYTGLRAALQFTPTDAIDIRLGADYYMSDTNSIVMKLTESAVFFPSVGALVPPDFWDVAIDAPVFDKTEAFGFSAKATIQFPHNMVLRSITAFRGFEKDFVWDRDGSNGALNYFSTTDEIVDQWSQELQLDARWGRWKWVLGFYYYHMDLDAFNWQMYSSVMGIQIDIFSETTTWAPFANIEYEFTDKLKVSAGVRYTYDEKEATYFTAWNTGIPLFGTQYFKEDWNAVTPKFTIDYRASEDMLLYATVSRGFRGGNFSPFTFSIIDPEFNLSYELGTKTDWYNNRLRVNIAAFYYDYTDLQVLGMVNNSAIFTNAAEASIKGVELEFLTRPIRRLTLNGTLSYLDTEYNKYIAPDPLTGGAKDVSGNQFQYAPKWKATFGAQYVAPVGEYGFLTVRGDLSWRDETFFDVHERDEMGEDGYGIINGFVRFETAEGHWSFEAYGKNLTEEEYYTGMSEIFAPTDLIGQLGAPRMYGLQINYKY